MSTYINELQIVFQKPVDPVEVDVDEIKAFGTAGTEPGGKKIVRLGQGLFAENTSIGIPVEIPVGPGARETVKRATMRALARYVHKDPDWRFFYVIARFRPQIGQEFFRTIVPRTAIDVSLRRLRYRNRRHRKP